MATAETYTLRGGPAEREADRLRQGHELVNAVLGDIIPSYLGIDTTKPLRVADVATGTGIWLIDAERLLNPSSKLDGFDISSAQILPTADLPKNSTFRVHDMRQPFADEFKEAYDIVHVRLVMYAVKAHEWTTVIENIQNLIRPGGWLIWEDTNYDIWGILPQSQSYEKFLEIDQAFCKKIGRDHRYLSKLKNYFEDSGLTNCGQRLHEVTPYPELYAQMTQLMLRLHTQSLNGAVLAGGVDGLKTAEDVESILRPIKQDVENGARVYCGFQRTWGQKPTQ